MRLSRRDFVRTAGAAAVAAASASAIPQVSEASAAQAGLQRLLSVAERRHGTQHHAAFLRADEDQAGADGRQQQRGDSNE